MNSIYFVSPRRDRWGRFCDDECPPLPHEASPPLDFVEGVDVWILLTYLHLRRRGCDVRLAPRIVPGAINVIHYDSLDWKHLPFLGFVVAVQADRGRPEMADLRVVQNRLCIEDPEVDHYVPHWPDAGLKPRDEGRGDRVETVGYFGRLGNLAPEFREDSFRSALEAMGLTLLLRGVPGGWSDYSGVDVILAVRSSGRDYLAVKPPSKLLNAWRAGCVAVLGREPAYRQVGTPSIDYLEVAGVEETLDALRRMREEPGLFAEFRRRGAARAGEFSEDEISRRWIELLEGPVRDRFLRWKRASGPIGVLSRAARFPSKYLAHRNEGARFAREALGIGGT